MVDTEIHSVLVKALGKVCLGIFFSLPKLDSN